MTTMILAAIALSGSLVPAVKPEFSAQTDYSQAVRRAAVEGKPMAVLIGTGDSFARVLGESAMTDGAAKLLREKFVCVNVDVSTAQGADLASRFQLTDGLVISSTGGTHQALRQPGTVTAADLAKHATTYANAAAPVTTVTVGEPAATTSAPHAAYAPAYRGAVIGGCAGGNCPNVIRGGYSFPSVGSSCPNGRCPIR